MDWVVSKSEEGTTLLNFLHSHGNLSKRKLKSLIDEGHCMVNDQVLRQGSIPLLSGDVVRLHQVERESLQFDPDRNLFENEEIIAYNKPAGMVCEPSGVPKQLQLVHRLDRLTTGVLLLAKSQQAFERMVRLFKQRRVKKTYLAVVAGEVAESSGRIHNRLGKVGEQGGKPVWGETEEGQEAITEWEVVSYGDGKTLLRCFPITGRTHQLRVHLSGMGHPILGDMHYGDQNYPTMLLHAHRVEFDAITVTAPLPQQFEDAIALWSATA